VKILQLSYDATPKRIAPAGGVLGMYQNLKALVDLGHEVHLALIATDEPVDEDVKGIVKSVHRIRAHSPSRTYRLLQRVLNPETFALRFPAAHGYNDQLSALVRELSIDLVWADSSFALAFAPRGDVPVVFGNYDFLFKLKAVRRETRRRISFDDLKHPRALRRRVLRRPDAFRLADLERYELGITREAAHVMCVSASEAAFCNDQGIPATAIPIVGPTIPSPDITVPDQPPRFFLFGNHNTAHAAALAEIRHVLWPALERASIRCEWHQVGRAPKHPDDDWRWMENTFDRVHGFVEDLGTVFQPGDVSVVPYRHDTGFRTKFTVAAAYGVISAGYHATFLCAPEFRPDVDCIAGEGPKEVARAFERVIRDREWRRNLAVGARKLYDAAFTFESQLPRYASILQAAKAAGPQRVRAHA
jgi:hypothetical protein